MFAEEVALFPFFYQVVYGIAGLAFCVFAGKELAVSLGAIAQSFIIGKFVLS